MFAFLKSLFQSKDEKELNAAKTEFDDLMKKVDDDEVSLTKLEKHVREEFEEIDDDVEALSERIDEAVKEKSPEPVK